ncbi:MAG: tetratricopeptide repeat protein, partial [Pirellulales bacterium]
PTIFRASVWALLGFVACGALANAPGAAPSAASEAPATPPQAAQPPAEQSIELSDPVEPLAPVKKRTGLEKDRVRALALFAAGRVAEQQQKYPEALRYYQRAFRFDPQASPAIKEIVPLAFSLDRQAEAVRYALILAERESDDPVLLRRLAVYLTEQGDAERAMALYEKALKLQAETDATPSLLVARMEMGRLYFVAKQFDKAAGEFGKILSALENPQVAGLDESMQKALLGKPELTYQLMGESFLETGELDKAANAFEKSQAANANDGLLAYNLARVELKRNQPAQAIARLQPYFDQQTSKQGTAPYQVLADALAQLGQSEQLIGRLEKIREQDLDNIPLTYFLAQQLREAGQLDKAEPVYADLIARHAARPPIEAFQGLVAVAHQRKDVDKLLTALGDAVGRVGTMGPLGASGQAVLDDAEISQALIDAAQRRLAEKPQELTYGQCLVTARLAMERDDFKSAGAFYEKALAAQPDKAGETLVTWGLEMFMADQFADAAIVFQRGLDEKLLADNTAALYFYLAGALEMDGRTDEALAAARKAAESQADSPRFASRVPWILYHAKRYDEARQGYQELIDKYGAKYDSDEARESIRDARLVMSNIAVLENRQEESEAWLEDLLNEFPEDYGALNDLGYLWADADKHVELALGMIQKAVQSDPKNMAYRDSLGWALYRLGRYDEAAAELKAAAADEEADGVILDHLGETLHKAGDFAGATDAWNRAVKAFEEKSETDKAEATRQKINRAQAATEAR